MEAARTFETLATLPASTKCKDPRAKSTSMMNCTILFETLITDDHKRFISLTVTMMHTPRTHVKMLLYTQNLLDHLCLRGSF
jgi:hypothetical protein